MPPSAPVPHGLSPLTSVEPPLRIVSLVPSLTELVVDLGLSSVLVGRTGFCIHPREVLRSIPKVGGTKGFDQEKIEALAPTHVLVNCDENRREEVEALQHRCGPGLQVIETHPLAPEDNPALFRLLGEQFHRPEAAESLVQQWEQAYAHLLAHMADSPATLRQTVCYFIWKDPWMTVARNTYISRMLALAGWDSLPGQEGGMVGADRYPVVDLELTRSADLILLPSEPYPFREKDRQQLLQHPALAGRDESTVRLVDGEMLSWYGSRSIAGLRYLAELRR